MFVRCLTLSLILLEDINHIVWIKSVKFQKVTQCLQGYKQHQKTEVRRFESKYISKVCSYQIRYICHPESNGQSKMYNERSFNNRELFFSSDREPTIFLKSSVNKVTVSRLHIRYPKHNLKMNKMELPQWPLTYYFVSSFNPSHHCSERHHFSVTQSICSSAPSPVSPYCTQNNGPSLYKDLRADRPLRNLAPCSLSYLLSSIDSLSPAHSTAPTQDSTQHLKHTYQSPTPVQAGPSTKHTHPQITHSLVLCNFFLESCNKT